MIFKFSSLRLLTLLYISKWVKNWSDLELWEPLYSTKKSFIFIFLLSSKTKDSMGFFFLSSKQALALIELYNAPAGRYKDDVYLLPKKMGKLFTFLLQMDFSYCSLQKKKNYALSKIQPDCFIFYLLNVIC